MKQIRLLMLILLFILPALACGGSGDEPEAAATQAPAAAQESATAEPAAQEAAPTAVVAVEAAEQTAVPTNTPEPAPEPTPEPVIEAGANYVSIDVDPGVYIYTNGDYIRDIMVYEGEVWVASLGGVLVWNPDSGAYRKYTTLDGLPHVGTYGITVCPAPEPTILVGTEEGLAAYDPDLDSWYLAENVFKTQPVFGLFGVSGADVGTLVCDTANNRLVMNYKGVTTVSLDDFSTRNTPGSALSWSGVRDLTVVGSGVWVSSGFRGYTVIDNDNVSLYSKHESSFVADAVRSIASGPDGSVWFAAGADGLVRLQTNGETTVYHRDTIANFASPTYVTFDNDGRLWVGFSSRVCQFDPVAQECVQDFRANSTTGMAQGDVSRMIFDEAGNLYYHTFDGGWSRYDGSQWTLYREDGLPVHTASSLLADAEGNVWFLSGHLRGTNLTVDEWISIRDVAGEDLALGPDGVIWSAGGRNLYRYDGFQFTRWQTADGVLDSYARAVAVADDGRVWLGQENGVSIWDGSSFTTYTTADDGWPEGRINDLLADGDVMWAATDKGLIRAEGEDWRMVLDSGVVALPSQVINALGKLPDGRLLLGTAAGLAYYDHEGRRVTADSAVTPFIQHIFVGLDGEILVSSASDQGGGFYFSEGDGEWLHVTTADGLPTNRVRSAIIDQAGTIWIAGGYFGSGGGLFRIVP